MKGRENMKDTKDLYEMRRKQAKKFVVNKLQKMYADLNQDIKGITGEYLSEEVIPIMEEMQDIISHFIQLLK